MRRECGNVGLQRKPLVSDPDMHAVVHAGVANPRWHFSQHSRSMRNPQFYVYGKRPMVEVWVGIRKFIPTGDGDPPGTIDSPHKSPANSKVFVRNFITAEHRRIIRQSHYDDKTSANFQYYENFYEELTHCRATPLCTTQISDVPMELDCEHCKTRV